MYKQNGDRKIMGKTELSLGASGMGEGKGEANKGHPLAQGQQQKSPFYRHLMKDQQ